ncbi:MAG: glyoxylate/hydroxypyruvate reductase A [Hyphomicrobiaceae bacterium]|nr:glyoxylate/hydroxypyruvate reductase A [Hyphomicrobiaceae bacterium]
MTGRLLIGISGWDPEGWLRRFTALVPERRPLLAGPGADLSEVTHVAAWQAPAGLFSRLPRLEAILSLGAGVDHLLKRDDIAGDVKIVRMIDPDLTGRMSEWSVWQVLDHHRQGRLYRDQQVRAHWYEMAQPAASAVRVGIMGLGVLGLDAAAKLASLGFRVAGWSRTPKQVGGLETHAGAEGLSRFLARTDILVVLLPLTPETDGILDRALFEGLARDGVHGGPIVINAGRGGLQNEADLLAALEDGTLKAASIDVFRTEPLPAESPFWGLANCTVTPHAAASSDPDALAGQVVASIAALERGEAPAGLVDRLRGY